MIYHKITHGFVIQRFDDDGKFLDQEFVAGNPVEYETQQGDLVDDTAQEMLHGCYQPFNMAIPESNLPAQNILKDDC